MAEIIESLTDGVAFEAPEQMSGPNVYRLKEQVMASFGENPKSIVFNFSEVEYIDLHGVVIFNDLCEIVRMFGARAYAYQLSEQMREILGDVDLLSDLGEVKPYASAMKTA